MAGKLAYLSRLRKRGLRVLCAACAEEHRHYFETRLRDARSPCCGARLVPKWHLKTSAENRFVHAELAARAIRLQHDERKRLSWY